MRNSEIKYHLRPVSFFALIFFFALFFRLFLICTTDNFYNGEENYKLVDALDFARESKLTDKPMVGPLNIYLLGSLVKVFHKPVLIGRLLASVFGVGCCLIGAVLAKQLFEDQAVYITTGLLLSFSCPLALFGSLSKTETVYSFWILLSLYFLTVPNKKLLHVVGAGLALSIASGIRYEAWALIPVIVVAVWFTGCKGKNRFIHAAAFAIVGALIPLYWIVACWATHGDPFISFRTISGGTFPYEPLFASRHILHLIKLFSFTGFLLMLIGMIFGKVRWLTGFFFLLIALVVLPFAQNGFRPPELKYLIAPIHVGLILAAAGLVQVASYTKRMKTIIITIGILLFTVSNGTQIYRQSQNERIPEEIKRIEAYLIEKEASPWEIKSVDFRPDIIAYLKVNIAKRKHLVTQPIPEHRFLLTDGSRKQGCPEGFDEIDFSTFVLCAAKEENTGM